MVELRIIACQLRCSVVCCGSAVRPITTYPEPDETLALMTVIDVTFMECPEWQPPDGAASAAQWSGYLSPSGTTADGEDGPDAGLPARRRQRSVPAVPGLTVFATLLAIERPNHVW